MRRELSGLNSMGVKFGDLTMRASVQTVTETTAANSHRAAVVMETMKLIQRLGPIPKKAMTSPKKEYKANGNDAVDKRSRVEAYPAELPSSQKREIQRLAQERHQY